MTNLNRRSFTRLLPFLAALPAAAAKRASETPSIRGLTAKAISLKPVQGPPIMSGSGLGVDASGRIAVKSAGISMRMELAEGRSLLFRDGALVGVMDANGCMEPPTERPACRILGTIVDDSQ